MIPNGVKIMFNLSVQIPVPSTKTDDSYDINDDVEIYFDTSNYEEGRRKRPLPVEKKKIDWWKWWQKFDEMGDKIIRKFAAIWVSMKIVLYELPHKLLNNLRLRILGN